MTTETTKTKSSKRDAAVKPQTAAKPATVEVTMDIEGIIAEELQIRPDQARAAVTLLDEGCTVPFIARYRKEATGALDDEQLRQLSTRLEYLRSLLEKKNQVLRSIEEQGKLTPELRREIEQARTMVEIEDLYRPYRPKRRTRAMIAREKGLQPLAASILRQSLTRPAIEAAAAYVSEAKGVADAQSALDGACDILAECFSDDARIRDHVRQQTVKEGTLSCEARDAEADSVYKTYYGFEEPVRKLPGYRVLAIDRGEREKFLNVRINAPQDQLLEWMDRYVLQAGAAGTLSVLADAGDADESEPASATGSSVNGGPSKTPAPASGRRYAAPVLHAAVEDGYKRLIAPSVEREIRSNLTDKAQDGAIALFGRNLRQLLMQPPVSGHVVLGWDPAFRTGCKLAVVDETGKVLDHTVVFPTAPTSDAKIAAARKTVTQLIRRYGISIISVGNGTASRESEQFIASLLKDLPERVQYVIVNEAGASVYSASELGTKEFPDLDVGGRSAASIARRLQDPLAELVKIEPKAIGVGQYQHDMNQKKLEQALGAVVEDCVNSVGVDLNTASASLLSYVSGLSKTVSAHVIAYREEHGRFANRRTLLKVPGLGPKAYQQCAGFLRITDGDDPLDATSVHPESYAAARALLKELEVDPGELRTGGIRDLKRRTGRMNLKQKAEELDIGELTLKDILAELEKPGRDPRREMDGPILRSDVLGIEDLKEGMVLKGTVRNIMDFGAFVDIGVHQDGLVHVSQMSDSFVRHPMDVVRVGDIVTVRVLSVDVARKRIALSMKQA